MLNSLREDVTQRLAQIRPMPAGSGTFATSQIVA
ncbi:MAG: hypothetical protein AAGJ31_07110 [Verrucomicrobiota bacterium]